MNAMSLQLTSSRMRLAPLALAVLMAAAPLMAAEAEKKAEESQVEIERQLADARMRLDTAAREVAELSMSMSEHFMPARGFVGVMHHRALLGINLGSRGEDLPEGVAVLSVSPGGAAEDAGLKAGDVLLAIDGQPLKRNGGMSARDQLMKAMGKVKPGDKVELRYRRDNKVATARVIAQAPMDRMFAMPPMPMAVRGRMAAGAAMPPLPPLAYMRAVGVFGSAELVPLTPKLGQYFGTEKGLLVVRAPADSRLKLEDGDVIVDIDGRTPANPTHAFRILGSYQAGEKLKLNVLRQKKRVSFDITIPDEPSASRRGQMLFHQLDGSPMHGPGAAGDHIMMSPAIPAMPLPPPPPGEAGTRIITLEDDRA